MELTQRQREVADRLAEGMTIAAIADDLGLTDSRVNQIIRALKDRFETDTQAGIVAAFKEIDLEGVGGIAGQSDDTEHTNGDSLVPELLNAPHPILYRLAAICAAVLMLALALFVLGQFASLMTDLAKDRYGLVQKETPDE